MLLLMITRSQFSMDFNPFNPEHQSVDPFNNWGVAHGGDLWLPRPEALDFAEAMKEAKAAVASKGAMKRWMSLVMMESEDC